MNWIKNVSTVIISLSLSLLIAESIIRILYPQDLSGSWRTRDEYGLLMNKSEGASFQSFGERRADYHFDNFGVRSSLVNDSNPESKVLVLGDSFTFGWLLNIEDTYIELLAQANKQHTFINAAAGGWGAADYTAYLETYCSKIKPDITLIVMNADDIGRMLSSKLYAYNSDSKLVTRSKYELTRRDLLKSKLNAFPLYSYFIENSHLFSLARSTYLGSNTAARKENELEQPKISTFGALNVASIDHSNKFSLAMFTHLKEVSKICETDLRVIFSGVQEKNNFEVYPTLEFIDYARKVSFFEEVGITFIDLTNSPQLIEYRNNPKKYIIENDGHPNEAGAELIYKVIHQSGIL
jgi:hypothetical protein